MALLVDDIAEAALGPWGLLIGVGVGAALLARKRLAPAASTALVGGMEATDRAREWASSLETPGKVAGAIGGIGVVERARTAVAEVGDWWSDIYAEARAEWEAGRGGDASDEPGVTDATAALEKAASRRRTSRGAGGRFVKAEDTAAE